MGLPQKRERVFFIALRKDLAQKFLEQKDMFTLSPKLDMEFKEDKIYFKEIFEDYTDRPLTVKTLELWNKRIINDAALSDASGRLFNKPNNYFQYNYLYNDKVANTIIANDLNVLFDYPRHLNKNELCKIGSYPLDYNFLNNKAHYLIGMSVPPVMTAQVASNIYEQWLSKIK